MVCIVYFIVVVLIDFYSFITFLLVFWTFWNCKSYPAIITHGKKDNAYDYFAIKPCESASGKIVGHLAMEISLPTKFLLQRRAVIKVALSSTNYRKSPLSQGRLEIPCRVSVSMPHTLENRQIIKKFKDMVHVLYGQPDYCTVLDSFLHHTIQIPKNSRKRTSNIVAAPILIDKRRKRQ